MKIEAKDEIKRRAKLIEKNSSPNDFITGMSGSSICFDRALNLLGSKAVLDYIPDTPVLTTDEYYSGEYSDWIDYLFNTTYEKVNEGWLPNKSEPIIDALEFRQALKSHGFNEARIKKIASEIPQLIEEFESWVSEYTHLIDLEVEELLCEKGISKEEVLNHLLYRFIDEYINLVTEQA